jgi:hypothetical protein
MHDRTNSLGLQGTGHKQVPCGISRLPSANTINALVLATALEFEVSAIATGDAFTRLSAPYRQVTWMEI